MPFSLGTRWADTRGCKIQSSVSSHITSRLKSAAAAPSSPPLFASLLLATAKNNSRWLAGAFVFATAYLISPTNRSLENTSISMSASTDASSAAAAGNAVSSLIGIAASVKEKWDTSGGNELLGKMSSSIPQGTKDYIGTASKTMFNREHIRPVTVFFGIGEERPFYVEKSPSLLMARLRHNATFFYLNYMLMFAVLFMLTLFISPSAIIGIGLLGLAWLYVIRASQDGNLKFYGITIPQKSATVGMAVISACVLIYLLSHIFWWTVGSGGLLISVHGFLRDASMHQDQDDKVDMIGDLSLDENASFLNPVAGVAQEV